MDAVPQSDKLAGTMTVSMAKRRLLLVEDSPDDAFFFYRTLAKTGIPCDCAHAVNGQDATFYLQENQDHAHLVFLDLKLPFLNGFEVLEWLNAQPFKERMEVIMLSGSDLASDIAMAQKLGAEYLVKPVPGEVLAEKIQAWLDKKHY